MQKERTTSDLEGLKQTLLTLPIDLSTFTYKADIVNLKFGLGFYAENNHVLQFLYCGITENSSQQTQNLTIFPESIGMLTQLEYLILKDHRIAVLPNLIGQLKLYLDIRGNQCLNLPHTMMHLSNLKTFLLPESIFIEPRNFESKYGSNVTDLKDVLLKLSLENYGVIEKLLHQGCRLNDSLTMGTKELHSFLLDDYCFSSLYCAFYNHQYTIESAIGKQSRFLLCPKCGAKYAYDFLIPKSNEK